MDDEAGLETAWNLYRAIREYDTVQDALCAAREAVIGQRGARTEGETVFDPKSVDREDPDHLPSRYTVRENQDLMRHAASIAAHHNLNDERVVAVITPDGLHAVAQAFWRELIEGEPTERLHFRQGVPPFFEMHPPIMASPVGIITLNPFAYRDEEAFMSHMMRELPLLYRRLHAEAKLRHDQQIAADDKAEEAHAKKVAGIVTKLNSKAPMALHTAWKAQDEGGAQAILRKMGFSVATAEYAKRYCGYDVSTAKWGEQTYQIRRTPENPAWRPTPLDADLKEIAGPLKEGRRNPFREFHKHARWWAEHKVDRASQRSIALTEGMSRSTVNEGIHELERLFVVT